MKRVSLLVGGLLLLMVGCNETVENQNDDQAVQSANLSIDTVGSGFNICEVDPTTITRIDNTVGSQLTYSSGYCDSNFGDTLVTAYSPIQWRLGQADKDTIAIFIQFPPTVVLDSITKGFYYKSKDCLNSGMEFNFVFHESTVPGQTQTTKFTYLIDKTEWAAQDFLLVTFNDYLKIGDLMKNGLQPGMEL